MTSQASLTKTKNSSPFWTNFKNNFFGTCAFPIMVLFLLGLIYPVMSFTSFKNILKANIIENPNYEIANNFKYILTDEYFITGFSSVLPFALLFAGVLLGVSKFRFMSRKNSVNVYFSLGITRTKLFASTYLAGAVQMLLAVFVPMLIVLFINIGYIGYSKELMLSILALSIGYFATVLFGFSVSSIITSAVGTTIEAILYSLILVLLPNIALGCISELMTLFLLGNEYSIQGITAYNILNVNIHPLSEKFCYLLPSNFMYDTINSYHTLTNKNELNFGISLYNTEQTLKWATPKFACLINWVIVSAAGLGVGIFTIKKRRAESAGFMGSNRFINFIITFIICFSSFCVLTTIFISFLPRTTSILLAMVGFILVYMVIEFILTRKFKLFIKGLIKLPIHVGIALVIYLLFATGLFGYSSNTPEISDIKKVDISMPAGSSLGFASLDYSSYCANVSFNNINGYLDSITSEDDFKTVTKLHKQIIKDGTLSYNKKSPAKSENDAVLGNIYIKYTLKDGKTLTRYYENVKVSTLTKLLELEETDRYKNLLESVFTKPISKKDSQKISDIKRVIQGEQTNIYMLSNHLDIKSPLTLNETQRAELLNCIAKDLKAQTATDANMPTSQMIGVISFVNNSYYDYYSNENGMSYKDEIINQEGAEQDSALELTKDMLTNISNTTSSSPQKYFVCVTLNMKNTINFIEENALLKYFDNDTKVVSAEIINSDIYYNFNSWLLEYDNGSTHQFIGGITSSELLDQNCDNEIPEFKQSYKTSDAKTIAQLEQNSYYSYFTPINNGYFVRYTLDNGDKIVMFIPESKVPNSVKDGVSNIILKNDIQ
ncbi:MAG: ABC transporter permease [Clostridia bacterium]|nr:ABC transporter permease [Clostridia bacterium]